MRNLEHGFRDIARGVLDKFGLEVHRRQSIPAIPDREYYKSTWTDPTYKPWLGGDEEFNQYFQIARDRTLVSPDRLHVLFSLCKQSLSLLDGDIWECGVYKGGTAAMFAAMVHDFNPTKRLHLFDTFEGMPETNCLIDMHKKGDFNDTSLAAVQEFVGHPDITVYHPGFIPETFKGLKGSKIAFGHVDVDYYKSVKDCCAAMFPQLVTGGFIIFDDYGFPSCPGARKAVDEYFSGSGIVPLVLPTGQAIVFKSK